MGNALGIAGSMASGIIEYFAEGAWTKRMHPGWAAQAGYRAARMAQAGFTGPRTLFEGEHGFFHAFANSDGCDFHAMLDGAGTQWWLRRHRLQALCLRHHGPSVYRLRAQARRRGGRARRRGGDRVQDRRRHRAPPVGAAAGQAATAQRLRRQVQHPVRHRGGHAARRRRPVEYEDAVVHDPAMRALAGKVRYVVDPDNPYPRRFTGHLRVTLASGEVREASQGHFRGGRDEPLSSAALEAKFIANCLYGGWDAPRAHRALGVLRALRTATAIDLAALRE
jgi:2-methylcitrate dehydratase PrpD